MDFVVELILQVVVQVIVEVVAEFLIEQAAHGAARVLRSRVGRLVLSAAVGLAAGAGWGAYLDGRSHWPNLLWVSLGLAALAGTLLVIRRRQRGPRPDLSVPAAGRHVDWRGLLALPWRWSDERLLGFAVTSFAVAAGIALAFRPG